MITSYRLAHPKKGYLLKQITLESKKEKKSAHSTITVTYKRCSQKKKNFLWWADNIKRSKFSIAKE
ncbi:hypothetical protein CW304_00865 [Bacillus sp. UFRGS-B20]|nr:hypothetical protein CW304_00865 [Bacillus sp. UFRGS-B20]